MLRREGGNQINLSQLSGPPTMISTTKMTILHNELPRDRKFVKDSCPCVSMKTRNLIFLRSVLTVDGTQPRHAPLPRRVKEYLVEDSGFGLDGVHREVGGSDLLCNTTGLAFLKNCLPNLKTGSTNTPLTARKTQ